MNQEQKHSEWNTILLGEALLFGLLGRIVYDQPDKVWLETLIKDDVFTEVPFGGKQTETILGLKRLQKWSQENRVGLSDQSFDDLRVDYTRLFVGVGKVLAPPWESVFFNEERMVFQEQTLQVRNWYRRFGLEPENLHKEPDDHIGLEMSFVSHLSELGMEALENHDEEKFKLIIDAKCQFLSEHLLKWGPSWCALIKKLAKTDFYQGLGYLTLGALNAIADQYDMQVPKEVVR